LKEKISADDVTEEQVIEIISEPKTSADTQE